MSSRKNPTYRALINSARWRRTRAAALSRDDGLCRDCLADGVARAATEVHHIAPVEWVADRRLMEQRMYDMGNLVSLCADCHRRRHQQMGSRSKEAQRERSARATALAYEEMFGLPTPGGVFLRRGGGRQTQTRRLRETERPKIKK